VTEAPGAGSAAERTRRLQEATARLASELSASRTRLEHLVRSSPVVVYSFAARAPYEPTFVSDNVVAFCGYTAEQLVSDPGLFGRRVHPDDRERVFAATRRLGELDHSVTEYRFRKADARWGWTRDEQVVVRDPAGRPVEVVGSLLDITDRKRAEDRSARMQELAGALAAALTPAQVADAALGPALAVLGAAGAALVLLDPDADRPELIVAGSLGFPLEPVERWQRFPLDSGTPAGDAVLTGTPLYLTTEDEARRRYPAMFVGGRPFGRSWAALPLRADRRVIGGQVGGDWYDVLALPDRRVALVVGDVVGRGLSAATTMGQLRSALAALSLSADSPAVVLDGLERFARQVDGARMATVAYAVLDPAGGEVRCACAGHPPPLVLLPDGTTLYLEGGRSPLLCALPPGAAGARTEGTYRLPPGARLVLFSDGLVERRCESLDEGLDRLAARAVAAPGGDDWCDRLVELMLDGAGDDDIALLGLTYAPVLRRRLPARAERLAGLRRAQQSLEEVPA
jgi:PAS domain S-box-containing protein